MANTQVRIRSPKGNVGVTDVVDAGELSAYSQGALSGFGATSAASFTIQIGGSSSVQDVAVGKNPAGESELFVGTSGTTIPFIIGGAPGTPGQSRTDALVLYKDPFTTSVVNNGLDVTDYAVVAGTPATTGTQVPPSMATIRSTIPTGSLKFVAVIGYVTIAQGQSAVTTGMFSRNMSSNTSSPVVVANITERNYLPLIAGLKCFQVDNAMEQWCDGTQWLNVPRLLKRVALTATGTLISVTGIPLRESLTAKIHLKGVGGTMFGAVRFNNDSSAVYAINQSSGGGAYSTGVNGTSLPLFGAAEGYSQQSRLEIHNPTNDFKPLQIFSQDMFGADASTTSNFFDARGKYTGSQQITRLDVIKAGGTGSFAAASYAEIYG